MRIKFLILWLCHGRCSQHSYILLDREAFARRSAYTRHVSFLRLDGCRHLAVDRERRQLWHMQDAVRRQLSRLQDTWRWLSTRYSRYIFFFYQSDLYGCLAIFSVFLTLVCIKSTIKKKGRDLFRKYRKKLLSIRDVLSETFLLTSLLMLSNIFAFP